MNRPGRPTQPRTAGDILREMAERQKQLPSPLPFPPPDAPPPPPSHHDKDDK